MTEPPPARILLIDDGETYETAIEAHLPELKAAGPRQPDGPAALAWLAANADRVDLVLLDLNFDVPEDRLLSLGPTATLRQTRRAQGVAILRALRARFPQLPVVMLTSAEDLPFETLRAELSAAPLTWMLGGDDLDALRIRVHEALAARRIAREEEGVFWGRDAAMVAVRRRLAVLARGRMAVILEGETGTGKSFIAERWLHAHSGRSGPFLAADLSTLPPDLVPGFLFGATRGAYTGAVADRKGVFELASGGTLFLDEVQNLAPEVQRQLLLVLQDRRVRPLGASRDVAVDVKVIAASNQSLAAAVASGRFRADLYMRLGPATRVTLPPLRTRRADLADLARHFVEQTVEDSDVAALRAQLAVGLGLPEAAPLRLVPGRGGRVEAGVLALVLPPPAWQSLLDHPWPGNVRELATVLHNLVVFTLVSAADALRGGVPLRSPRLQVDAGVLSELLGGSLPPGPTIVASSSGRDSLPFVSPPASAAEGGAAVTPGPAGDSNPLAPEPTAASAPEVNVVTVQIRPADSLNGVAQDVERQFFRHLFRETGGDFGRMAVHLLGDAEKARAVRLRFNQLGLSARALRGP